MQYIIYSICLVTHITGIVLMAGASFIDYIIFRQFWKVWPADTIKAMTTENLMNRLQKYMGIGMLFILLSGAGMMIYLHGVYGQQTWFRIKMGVLLLVIINGLAIRRRLGASFNKELHGHSINAGAGQQLLAIKRNISSVQLIQLFLFVIIFTLSVFKFN